MSASQKTTKSTKSKPAGGSPDPRDFGVLVFPYGEDRPRYELTGDKIRWLFSIRHLSRRIDLLIDMKPYRNSDAIALQKVKEPYIQAATDEADASDVKQPSSKDEADFCNRYLIEVTHKGKPVSKETLDRLDGAYQLRRSIVREGYNAIRMTLPEEREVENLEEELGADLTIAQFLELADSQGVEHRVDVAHVLRFPTVQDSLDWDECKTRRHGSGGKQRIAFRYERIEALYDRMVTGLQGFLHKGDPCDSSNRAKWVPAVPFYFKLFAMFYAFGEAKRGNG